MNLPSRTKWCKSLTERAAPERAAATARAPASLTWGVLVASRDSIWRLWVARVRPARGAGARIAYCTSPEPELFTVAGDGHDPCELSAPHAAVGPSNVRSLSAREFSCTSTKLHPAYDCAVMLSEPPSMPTPATQKPRSSSRSHSSPQLAAFSGLPCVLRDRPLTGRPQAQRVSRPVPRPASRGPRLPLLFLIDPRRPSGARTLALRWRREGPSPPKSAAASPAGPPLASAASAPGFLATPASAARAARCTALHHAATARPRMRAPLRRAGESRPRVPAPATPSRPAAFELLGEEPT